MDKINVVIYGCGVMGRNAAQAFLDKKQFNIVGAIDISKDLVGKDLGAILDRSQKIGIIIDDDVTKILSTVQAHAVVLMTTSHLERVFPQIQQCIEAGLNVISTSEELAFPWKRSPELAQKIDQLAKEQEVTVIGTGINPGYLMDTLPLIMTAPCLQVDSIKVTRMMDSSKRRIPFQAKVGTGLTKEAFTEKIENLSITGHVGLLESINMIAAGLGWELDEAIEMPPEPKIGEKEIETLLGKVSPGDVIGLTSIAYGVRNGQKVITLEFCANAGVEEEYDEIIIKGKPDIHQKVIGGIHGDIGTVAMTINTIPRAVAAPSGLYVMKDLPPPVVTL